MIIIKSFILYLVLLFVFYRLGLIVNKLLNLENNYFSIILYGFILAIAVMQIMYIPMILLHISFKIVLIITICSFLLLLIFSFFIIKIKDEKYIFKTNFIKLKNIIFKNIILTCVLLLIITLQIIFSTLLFNENADDAFYVSLVQQNMESESIYSSDPSLGINNTTFISKYMVSGHELALSVLSKIFNIAPTILCHTVLIPLFILLSYIAYYILAKEINDKNNIKLFLLLLSIVFLFSGFTTRFRGILLLSRIWQGKEIFLNIILTLIISVLINNIYDDNRNIKKLILLNFSAVFFSNTSMFLVPFAYMGIGIVKLIKREFKSFFKLLISGIPIIIYAIIYFLIAQNAYGDINTNISIIDVIKEYFGTGKLYIILYLVSVIVIAIKGNRKAKIYFLVVPLIYILTIYNPIFTGFIVKYFTGSSVFWRLLWLLPVEFSIVYSYVLIFNMGKNNIYKSIILTLEILSIIVCGGFVYTKSNGFYMSENLNKIPEYIIEQTQFIINDSNERKNDFPVVMAPLEPLHNTEIRQLTSKIKLFWSRDHYMKELYSNDEIEEMNKINIIYYGKIPDIDINQFDNIREKYNVDYIIIDDNNADILNYLDKTKLSKKIRINNYYIYEYY